MAKVKRNVRAKAKNVLGAAKQKAQDVQAQLTKDSRQEQLLHKTKKEKSAEKHKKLLGRFVQLKKERKEESARKNRQKAPLIGDLKPLRDALPSLQDIYKLVKSKKDDPALTEQLALAEPVKLSAKQKIKKQREDLVKRVGSFQKLIKDKKFKQNPREVIATHVRNKYKQMDEEDE